MKTARETTDEYLQDIVTSQQRVAELNESESKIDAFIELVVSLVLIGIIGTGLGLLYHYQEEDFTDTGVGCIDDCLDLEERK